MLEGHTGGRAADSLTLAEWAATETAVHLPYEPYHHVSALDLDTLSNGRCDISNQ